jgi:protein involved in polysaccharide export with SLBB domain
MITLPLIGELRAGGLTANEVRDGIRARLERYKEVPEVSVTVADVRVITSISWARSEPRALS